MTKVVAGRQYIYNPVLMDVCNPPFGGIKKGDIVKVVNRYGCPRAGVMGMCYVEHDGKFAGMVCVNSLVPLNDDSRWAYTTDSQLQNVAKLWAEKYTFKQLRAFQKRYSTDLNGLSDVQVTAMQNRWQCATWAIDRKAFPELWK